MLYNTLNKAMKERTRPTSFSQQRGFISAEMIIRAASKMEEDGRRVPKGKLSNHCGPQCIDCKMKREAAERKLKQQNSKPLNNTF